MGFLSRKKQKQKPETVAEILAVFHDVIYQLEEHYQSKTQESSNIAEQIVYLTTSKEEAEREAAKAMNVKVKISEFVEV